MRGELLKRLNYLNMMIRRESIVEKKKMKMKDALVGGDGRSSVDERGRPDGASWIVLRTVGNSKYIVRHFQRTQ